MSNYLEKYHLKKVEPVKSRPRINYLDYLKMHSRPQKVGVVKVPNKRKIPHRNYFRGEEDRPSTTAQNSEKNIKMDSSPLIEIPHQRKPLESPVKKMQRTHKSLNFKSGKDSFTGVRILNSIQGFFNKIMRNNEGCSCDEPCEWSSKFFRWVDVPLEIISEHYKKLLLRWEPLNAPNALDSRQKGEEARLMEKASEKANEQNRKTLKQILKDIQRTQSDSLTFQNPIFKEKQRRILMSYACEDPKVGYIQGMNVILSGILYHVKEETKSFAVFRNLILNVRSMYLQDFRECYTHIAKVRDLLEQHVHDLWIVFQQLCVDLNIVCLPWVLSILTCMVPLQHLHLLYDGFIRERWTFIYKACLAIFIYHKDAIMSLYQPGDILALLSPTNDSKEDYDWEDIMIYANSITL